MTVEYAICGDKINNCRKYYENVKNKVWDMTTNKQCNNFKNKYITSQK